MHWMEYVTSDNVRAKRWRPKIMIGKDDDTVDDAKSSANGYFLWDHNIKS